MKKRQIERFKRLPTASCLQATPFLQNEASNSFHISLRFKTNKAKIEFSTKKRTVYRYLPFFPALLESTIEDPQELHKGEHRKVDWERMSRQIESAWKQKKNETYLNIEKRNFQR